MNRSPRAPAPGAADRWSAADRELMGLALEQARRAAELEEVPVGAVVALDGRPVAEAGNRTRAERDPSAHAELLALRAAAARLGSERLVDCTVYSTLEPCFMCAGALSHARVARLVFAARDPKFGACASLARVLEDPRLNHRALVEEGLLAEESAGLLRSFFRALRAAEGDS